MGRNCQSAGEDRPDPKTWGRRPYADKAAREQMNDISAAIARRQPDDVDDPSNPALSDVIRHADAVAGGADETPKADTLAELLGYGLNFQEAVCWYWYAVAQYSFTEVHYAISGHSKGGDPDQRRNSVRNIHRVLKSAAFKHPDEDPADVPDLDETDINA